MPSEAGRPAEPCEVSCDAQSPKSALAHIQWIVSSTHAFSGVRENAPFLGAIAGAGTRLLRAEVAPT